MSTPNLNSGLTSGCGEPMNIQTPYAFSDQAFLDRIQEPQIADFFRWWITVKLDDPAPSRAAFDPADHVNELTEIALVGTADRLEDFVFRVHGSRMSQQFGEERNGKRFSEIEAFENFDEVMEGYWRVYKTGRPHYFTQRVVSSDRLHAGYARLLVPLLGPDAKGPFHPEFILARFTFFPKLVPLDPVDFN